MRYTFAECYLVGLKWVRQRWQMHFIEPRFWDEAIFRKCACGTNEHAKRNPPC